MTVTLLIKKFDLALEIAKRLPLVLRTAAASCFPQFSALQSIPSRKRLAGASAARTKFARLSTSSSFSDGFARSRTMVYSRVLVTYETTYLWAAPTTYPDLA